MFLKYYKLKFVVLVTKYYIIFVKIALGLEFCRIKLIFNYNFSSMHYFVLFRIFTAVFIHFNTNFVVKSLNYYIIPKVYESVFLDHPQKIHLYTYVIM